MLNTAESAATGFDAAAWREELLALNPWARDPSLNDDKVFAAARQQATLERFWQGKDAWNAWAKAMLGLKTRLVDAGGWVAKREFYRLTGENEYTQGWLELATAAFSTIDSKHAFDGPGGVPEIMHSLGVSFAGATFPGATQFIGATFPSYVSFAAATFSGDAWFADAIFSGGASFADTTFSGDTRFVRATFSSDARFVGATFSGNADWSAARFHKPVDMTEAKFAGAVVFDDSVFEHGADFAAIDSKTTFSLANATFRQVPNVLGATFRGLRLDNVDTPAYPLLGWTRDKDATARFRELKRRAEDARDHDRELEFFAQEIRTSRFHAKGLPSFVPRAWEWRFWFGLLYGTFSDFGRSLWRPLLFWLLLLAGFATFYLGEHEQMRNARAAFNPGGALSALAGYAATTRSAWANPPGC
jgi:uncharacterized protein YjbI with pentapeptide repeats